MPEIIVQHDELLHRILDILEPIREQTARHDQLFKTLDARVQQMETGVETMNTSWKTLLARCDELDKKLPYGNKVYVPLAHGRNAAGRQMVENFISDVARVRYGTAPIHFDRKSFRIAADGIERANQMEGTNSAGGFLVPEEVAPEVLALIGEVGVARRICRIYAMNRKDMKLPVRASGPTVSWPGEGTKPAATAVVFGRPELNSKTMVALDEISEEVDMDSIVPLAPLLTDLFAEAVALEEDKQTFNSAAAPFTGVLQAANVVDVNMPATKTTFADASYTDFVNLKHAIDSKVVQQGTYVMHQDVIGIAQKIRDTTGQPIWRESLGGAMVQGPPGTILGRPYYTTNAMPGTAQSAIATPFVIYGDFRYHAFGDRMRMQIDISSEAGFTEFTKWMRVVERVAFVVAIPTAFSRLRTAAS